MFWASLWDSKFSHNKLIKEDYFIRSFIINLFKEKVSRKSSFFVSNFLNILKSQHFKKYDLDVIEDLNSASLSKYLFKVNKVPNYFSKIRIIRFQSWVIIFFKIHSPILIKKKKLKKSINFSKYFFLYYSSTLSNKLSKFDF